MKKFFNWLGIQDAFERGLIGRILVIFCLVFISFGAVFLIYRLVLALHPDFSYGHWTDLLLESLILVFGLVSLWLIRTDRMRAASWVFCWLLFRCRFILLPIPPMTLPERLVSSCL